MPGSIRPEICEKIMVYIREPETAWGDAGHRHAKKVARLLRERAPDARAADTYLERLVQTATKRQALKPKHVYLINPGSSGSHWITKMLSYFHPLADAGEVYFSSSVLGELQVWPRAEALYFLDVVYLHHVSRDPDHLADARIINSAHLAMINQPLRALEDSPRILLVRDVVDAVVSRTYRKPEFRTDSAPGMTDQEYATKNCDIVTRFYDFVLQQRFDAVVRYEDFVARPDFELARLLRALRIPFDDSKIERAIAQTSKDAVVAAAAEGKRPPTNLYLGDAIHADPGVLDCIRTQMRETARRLDNFLRGGSP